jgi:hypothetical protein
LQNFPTISFILKKISVLLNILEEISYKGKTRHSQKNLPTNKKFPTKYFIDRKLDPTVEAFAHSFDSHDHIHWSNGDSFGSSSVDKRIFHQPSGKSLDAVTGVVKDLTRNSFTPAPARHPPDIPFGNPFNGRSLRGPTLLPLRGNFPSLALTCAHFFLE